MHGSGGWLEQQHALMDVAAVSALVAEASGARSCGNGSSSGQCPLVERVRLPDPQAVHVLGQFGHRGVEGVAVTVQRGHTRRQRQPWCTFGELDEIATDRSPRRPWSTRCAGGGSVAEEVTIRDVQRAQSVDEKGGRRAGEELRRQERQGGVEEVPRQDQPKDVGEPHRTVAKRHQAQEDQEHAGDGKSR